MYNPLKNTTMKKLLTIITLALAMQSCICIKITHPSYVEAGFMRDLTSEQKNNVYWTSDSTLLSDLTNDGRIYAINPNQMKELLATQEKAIIYRWLTICKSENCTSLGLTQSYCDEKGIELYVITDSYTEAFTQIVSIKNPMFSMNIGYFQTQTKTGEIREEFYKILLGDKYDKKNYGRFYYFENGEFIRQYNDILEATAN